MVICVNEIYNYIRFKFESVKYFVCGLSIWCILSFIYLVLLMKILNNVGNKILFVSV